MMSLNSLKEVDTMEENNFVLPHSVYIYKSDNQYLIDTEEIARYLSIILPQGEVIIREEFFSSSLKGEGSEEKVEFIAYRLAECRVHNINTEIEENTAPLPGEVGYEKRLILSKQKPAGVIYDGFYYQALCKELIIKEEQKLSFCHIIFTNQLLATFDENDKRYHLRVGIYGIPNIISLKGLTEALAKPREYYLKIGLGVDPFTLKKEFKKEIISEEASSIRELIKGYCIQALFYHITGSAFCEDKHCRLYNAHWQKEAIQAQTYQPYEFCPLHSQIISSWRKKRDDRGNFIQR